MENIYTLGDIQDMIFELLPGDIVFFYGDLAAGKTTFIKHLLTTQFPITNHIQSPTYTYYNKYLDHIYHFDLYRLQNYDEFFAIGGEEILENPQNISLIEWPEIIKPYFTPTKEVFLEKLPDVNERKIIIKEY